MIVEERYLRQLDILDPAVCNKPVSIIGAGATGSFTALALAKMGMTKIDVFDKDSIEEHNFPNQLFPTKTLGMNKAEALKEVVKEYTDVDIDAKPVFYNDQALHSIVIVALDTMVGRKKVFQNSLKGGVELLIDSRTGAELFMLLTVDMRLECIQDWYKSTLHSDKDADPLPCTARAIIYSVLLVSAYICSQVKKFVMHEEYKKELFVDLKNNFQFNS